MDDSELKDHDSGSEPQPCFVTRHNTLDACINMRFLGYIANGDGKRSGTEIRNRGHWAFIKIGYAFSHTERTPRSLCVRGDKSAKSILNTLLSLLARC